MTNLVDIAQHIQVEYFFVLKIFFKKVVLDKRGDLSAAFGKTIGNRYCEWVNTQTTTAALNQGRLITLPDYWNTQST